MKSVIGRGEAGPAAPSVARPGGGTGAVVSSLPALNAAAARHVLVLRFSALGDVVLTTPALEALKSAWPDTRVTFVTGAGLGCMVRHSPYVDEVVELQKGQGMLAFCNALRARGPDAVLDLHGRGRTRVIRMLLPGARTVVWEKRPWQDTVPVKLRLRPYHARMHISARYHRAVEELVGRTLPRGTLHHGLPPDGPQRAAELLVAHGVSLDVPVVGMSPGANWATKRWPLERYAELAARAQRWGAQVVVTGSPDENTLAEQLVAAAPGAVNLCGKVKLDLLGSVVARCTAFVANDSGPMHLARALGVPTLTFFGSTDPRQFQFDGHAALFAGTPCAPCSFFGLNACPKGHFACMMDLTVDAAADALRALLDGGAHPRVQG